MHRIIDNITSIAEAKFGTSNLSDFGINNGRVTGNVASVFGNDDIWIKHHVYTCHIVAHKCFILILVKISLLFGVLNCLGNGWVQFIWSHALSWGSVQGGEFSATRTRYLSKVTLVIQISLKKASQFLATL